MYSRPDAVAAAAAVTAASPLAGDYAVIVMAAFLGSFVALSLYPSKSRLSGALFIFRSVSIALVSTWAITLWVSKATGLHITVLLPLVAFGVAVIGDGWFTIKDKLIEKWTR